MSDIFVDGIRSIAVANGVTRIELLQLKRGKSKTKLEPEVVATLMIPVAALKDFTSQLATTLQKINEGAKKGRAKGAKGGDDVANALENL
ncbi:MAG: hypothetical protein V3S27_09060 [Kiloniellales bacterium]